MKEVPLELVRKNNIAAFWFLTTAILSVLLLIFMCFVFTMIFGSINAIFASLGGKAENGFSVAALWQLYAVFFLCVGAIVSQFTAFWLIKTRSRFGRIAGIVSFFLTVLIFTPLSLLLIYPFAFLLGNNGKYIYQNLSENNLSENNLK